MFETFSAAVLWETGLYSRRIMFYKGLKNAAGIFTNDLFPTIRHVKKHHSLAFQTPFLLILTFTRTISSPQTITDWNSLTDSLISAAEGAEDSVANVYFSCKGY